MIASALRGVLTGLLALRARPGQPDKRGALIYEDPATRLPRALCSDGTDVSLYTAPGSGSGDVVGPSSSVDGEIALFDSTTGKLLKRASSTGILVGTSGVIGVDAGLTSLSGVDTAAGLPYISAANTWTKVASLAVGDLFYATSASALARLGIGSPGQLLKVAGGVPTWGTAVAATTTQAFSGSATMTTDVDHVHATASGTLTLPAVSSSTIGHSTLITGRATSALTLVLAADAADKIEGAAKLELFGTNIVATLTPVASNRWVVGVIRGRAEWQHCGIDLTAASGSSPWTLTTTNGDSTTWTELSTASCSVAAATGFEFTSNAGSSYYTGNTGAVVKSPISGFKDAWGRALTTRDSFWFLVKEARTTGSTTVPQTGIVLAGTAISTVPKLGVAMTASGGVLQTVYRLTSNATVNYAETYLAAAHWLGGWYSPEVRGFRRVMLNVATSGEPGDEWWPSAYQAAADYRWGQDYHGQILEGTLLTDLHLTQVGATDKFTMTFVAIIMCQIGSEGE